MAEEPQNYPPYTPQEMPPVAPTQAYPAPQYPQVAPQQYAPMPEQQVAPVVAQPMPVTPMPPRSITPAQGKPIRKGRGGSAALVWLLGGCGVLALVFIVAVSYFAMNLGSTITSSTNNMATAQQNLDEIRDALNTYTKAHQGHYPPSLDKIVNPETLVYTSKKGEKVHVEYMPPTENSAEDAGVAGFYLGNTMKLEQIVDQKLYIRLLKNGNVVQEQITRSPLPGHKY